MKRSEIIRLMVKTAQYHDGAYLEPYAAEKLLEALEEAGMLPPQVQSKDSNFMIIFNGWEPEEEA
jgi:hypothetical protein